jgi:hypothetical protein
MGIWNAPGIVLDVEPSLQVDMITRLYGEPFVTDLTVPDLMTSCEKSEQRVVPGSCRNPESTFG